MSPIFLKTDNSKTNEITEEVSKKVNFIQKYLDSIDWDALLATIITKSVTIVLMCVLFVIIFKIGQKTIQHAYSSYAKHTSMNTARIATIKRLIDSLFYYTVFFIALYTLLSILGVPMGSLIAGAGIFGLAIGLGAQGFMNDLITGFFIILEQQIDVGDNIKLQNLNIEGNAVSVGIRTTKIKSVEGFIHYIPNRNLTTITNLSRSDIKVSVDIRIEPTEGIEKITKVIEEKTEELAQIYRATIAEAPKIFGLVDQGSGNFAIRTVFSAVNGEQFNLKQAFTTEYVKALTDNDFTIPSVTNTPK